MECLSTDVGFLWTGYGFSGGKDLQPWLLIADISDGKFRQEYFEMAV